MLISRGNKEGTFFVGRRGRGSFSLFSLILSSKTKKCRHCWIGSRSLTFLLFSSSKKKNKMAYGRGGQGCHGGHHPSVKHQDVNSSYSKRVETDKMSRTPITSSKPFQRTKESMQSHVERLSLEFTLNTLRRWPGLASHVPHLSNRAIGALIPKQQDSDTYLGCLD